MRRGCFARVEVPIDKGIPIPPYIPGAFRKYPWEHMEIGDSFVYDGDNPKKAYETIRRIHRRLDARFDYRVVTEGEKEIIRVWRVL